MNLQPPISISGVLASAITPVTLLTGVAFLTSIMAPRFGRCIDRIRIILAHIKVLRPEGRDYENHLRQLEILYARTRFLRHTMTAAGLCIFFVVLTVLATFSHLIFAVPGPGLTVFTFLGALFWLLLLTIGFIYDFMVSLNAVKLEIDYCVGSSSVLTAIGSRKVSSFAPSLDTEGA